MGSCYLPEWSARLGESAQVSWIELEQTVASEVLLAALETSDKLRQLGVPHALVGGLAVGHHGHPRATKDADFIVGDQAFAKTSPLLVYRDELASVVRVGTVDLLATTNDPSLQGSLVIPQAGIVPIAPISVLVLMKLRASRPQDLADVALLIKTGMDMHQVLGFLSQHAPEHVATFTELTRRAL